MAQAFSPFRETRQTGGTQPSIALTLAAHGLDAVRFVQMALEHAVRPRPEASRQLADALRGTNPALAGRIEARLPARIQSDSERVATDHGHTSVPPQSSVVPLARGREAVAFDSSRQQPAHGHEYVRADSTADPRRSRKTEQ
ncbi:hypothetical protein L0Y65_02725 [Candidatus Micrarchaeota archaeon]|nr:hypothetical protein [Candidatus Micrarchaeota archaeon]